MRLLYKLGRYYDRFTYLTWIISIIPGIITPILSYGTYAYFRFMNRRDTMADSPETAQEITVLNPLDWFTHMNGWLRIGLIILILLGILMLLTTILAKIGSYISQRTQLSGRDKEELQREQQDQEAIDEDDWEENY